MVISDSRELFDLWTFQLINRQTNEPSDLLIVVISFTQADLFTPRAQNPLNLSLLKARIPNSLTEGERESSNIEPTLDAGLI